MFFQTEGSNTFRIYALDTLPFLVAMDAFL